MSPRLTTWFERERGDISPRVYEVCVGGSSGGCPTVLGPLGHPGFCPFCVRAFERAGVVAAHEQLELLEEAA